MFAVGLSKLPIVLSCVNVVNEQHEKCSIEEIPSSDEGANQFDSKSFSAKPSKFQSNPLKTRHKVLILNSSEEKELLNGGGVSLNNHTS